ncbi:MAG: STAS domain-containing protein [Alphaproteobacteria bacterium]|nr:STAS domain-containing protein [Alphaproteobacteria bacterium]
MADESSTPPDAPNLFTFALPALMTIETAEIIADGLKELPFPPRTRLTLDAAQVENIATPGLQIILALKKSLAAQGGDVCITGARDALARCFADAGLAGLLEPAI